jgi:MerR family transcriptional regulator/heat shock protein HspR
VLALRSRVAELSAELDVVRASAGRGTRVFSVSPSGDVYAARLGERPRHDRSTALVVWRPHHG